MYLQRCLRNISLVYVFLQNSIYNAKTVLLLTNANRKNFSIINIKNIFTFFCGASFLLESAKGPGAHKLLDSGTWELLDPGTEELLDPGS